MPFFGFGGSGKTYHCRVLLLDDSYLTHEISSKTKGLELLDKVFMSLNLYEKDYFGLRFRDIDDKTQWLDPEKSIKKQIDGNILDAFCFIWFYFIYLSSYLLFLCPSGILFY